MKYMNNLIKNASFLLTLLDHGLDKSVLLSVSETMNTSILYLVVYRTPKKDLRNVLRKVIEVAERVIAQFPTIIRKVQKDLDKMKRPTTYLVGDPFLEYHRIDKTRWCGLVAKKVGGKTVGEIVIYLYVGCAFRRI